MLGEMVAVVLAAGRSSRMGRPKALLRDRDGESFISRVVRTLGAAGLRRVLVVAAPATRNAIAAALRGRRGMPEVDVVVNEDPDRGQLSSLLTGLEAAGDIESLLVTLVDVPFVSESTVRSVILGYRDTQAPIVRPARGPLHGHPVIFDRAVFDDLRTAPFDAGAKHVIRACQARVLNVPTEDDGAFLDLDTPDDYRGALAR